jgi:hypothetical protein
MERTAAFLWEGCGKEVIYLWSDWAEHWEREWVFLFHTFAHIHNPVKFFLIVACREPLLGYSTVNNSVTVIAHATEEHVTFAVTLCNNRRAMGSGVAAQSGTRHTVPQQWNSWDHPTHINRGTMFSVRSTLRPYHSTDQVEFS